MSHILCLIHQVVHVNCRIFSLVTHHPIQLLLQEVKIEIAFQNLVIIWKDVTWCVSFL